MDIEFDAAKDVANIAKHGVSLSRAADLDVLFFMPDERFTAEARFRAYGLIEDELYCLAFTFRDERVRAINLRRARAKEVKRYEP